MALETGKNMKNWTRSTWNASVVLGIGLLTDLSVHAQEGFRAVASEQISARPIEKLPLSRTNPDYQVTERAAHHQVWE